MKVITSSVCTLMAEYRRAPLRRNKRCTLAAIIVNAFARERLIAREIIGKRDGVHERPVLDV